jgi:hypothetical protein
MKAIKSVMEILVMGGTSNRMEITSRRITVVVDPTSQSAFRKLYSDAAHFVLAQFGRDAALPFLVANRQLVSDNSLWDAHGKWLGKKWKFSWRIEAASVK